MSGKIFISYRRSDDPGTTRLLYERLNLSPAVDEIFMDVDNIPLGRDFVQEAKKCIHECDLFVAMIGPRWSNAKDKAGNLRLNNTNDNVRIEIETALRLGKHVIPLLVSQAEMPNADDLPESLKALATLHAPRVSHESFNADAGRLIEAVEKVFGEAEAERPKREESAKARAEEDRRTREAAAWNAVATSTDAAKIERFIAAWPDGKHADAARSSLAARKKKKPEAKEARAQAKQPAEARLDEQRREQFGATSGSGLPQTPYIDQPPQPRIAAQTRVGSLGEAVDKFFATKSPMTLWGVPVIIGLLLIWSSGFVGIDDIHTPPQGLGSPNCGSSGKQVGVWTSLNWSVVYPVLFPICLICISTLARHIRRTLNAFIDHGVIVDAYGHRPDRSSVHALLDAELRSNSKMFYLLVAGVIVLWLGSWWIQSGWPLLQFELSDQVIGWATVIIPCGMRDQQYPALIYSFIAYVWGGIALFVYLSCLFLGFIYASFLAQLAYAGDQRLRSGPQFRLVFRANVVGQYLSPFLMTYFLACVFGLLAGYFMRLQATYLYSSDPDLVSFWLHDLRWLASLFGVPQTTETSGNVYQISSAKNQTLYTGLVLTAATMLSLLGTGWMLYTAFQSSKAFVLTPASTPTSVSHRLFQQITPKELKAIENESFISAVVRWPGAMIFATISIILATIFARHGIVFLAAAALVAIKYSIDILINILLQGRTPR